MQKGFTIIELLIVIVVIGILVAIGIMSYSGYQRRAFDASVQSDLESISGELEAYRARDLVNNASQRFPQNPAQLLTLEIQAAKNSYDTAIPYNLLYCIDTSTGQAFLLVAQSKSGKIFAINQDGFRSHSFTTADLDTNFCSTQSLGGTFPGVSNGTWASWVRSS